MPSLVALLLSCAFAPGAFAKCNAERIRFFVDRDDTYRAKWEIYGEGRTCSTRYTAGGRTTFDGLKVLVHPKHGKLEPHGAYSTISFSYRAKTGFNGTDFFVAQICGDTLGRKGCARLEYTIVVRD
jgi:hypothetical protein